jgi:hypothetical protein
VADPTSGPVDDGALAAAFRGARQPSGDHLSETQWERLACDEMHPAERDTALAHILSCADCTAIHRSLMELRAGATEIEGLAPQPAAGSSQRRWAIVGGLGAAAALILAVLVDQPSRPNAGSEVARSDRAAGGVTVIAPAIGSVLADRHFAWQPVAGADSYELRVHTDDGGRVFTSRRDETSANLPADTQMPRGAYYWQVTAFKDGATIASSPMIPFRVD